MGVGGCEIKTIGYTCRSVVRTVFGPGFNSRRLHHAVRGEQERATRSPLAGWPYERTPVTLANRRALASSRLPSFVPWGSHRHPRFVLLLFGTLIGLPSVVGVFRCALNRE